jgi:hypothetical protein
VTDLSAISPQQLADRVRQFIGNEWMTYEWMTSERCVQFGCEGEHEEGCPFWSLQQLQRRAESREQLEAKAKAAEILWEHYLLPVTGENLAFVRAALGEATDA